MLKVGDKVTVQIADPVLYAFGAADTLNGLTGIVEEVCETNYLGYSRNDPYLVRFDPHDRPSWWTHGSKPSAFWFSSKDLVST